MRTISVAGVTKLLLLGGGDLLADACELAAEAGLGVTVAAARRHLEEELAGGATLAEHLVRGGIPHLVCAAPDDARLLQAIDGCTAGLSLGAPWIFDQDFIGRFEGRLFNLHSTPLPRFRGGASYSWMALMAERRGASILHQITPDLDRGDLLLKQEYPFPASCRTPQDYFTHARRHDRALMKAFMEQCASGAELPLTPQSREGETYFPRLATDLHGFIDWSWSGGDIAAFVQAFDAPYPGASTFIGDERVRIRDCTVVEGEAFHPFQSGIVYARREGALLVCACGQALRIGLVSDEAGRDVTSKVAPGIRFHTPGKHLDEARATNAVYTPEGLKAGKTKL